MEYTRTKTGAIQFRKKLPDDSEIVFQATNVRRAATGIHARLKLARIATGEIAPLAGHTFNIENAKDITWLSGRAHSKLPKDMGRFYAKDTLEDDIATFCDGLWEEQLGTHKGGFFSGDTERRATEFVLRPFIVPEGGTILFAPPKRGKSYMGMLMAVSVDAGIDRIWKVKQGRALYINLERSAKSMQYRLGRVNEALGLPADRPLLFIHARGKSLADIHDAASRMVEEHNVVLVVLDSLSRSGVGKMVADDNANSAMDMLNSLGTAWLALGHTPRDEEGHVYGSQMFDAAADILVQQLTEQRGDKLIVGLQMKPSNDVPTAKLSEHLYTYEFDDYGLKGVRPADSFEAPALLVGEEMTIKNRVVAHLKSVGEDDATSTEKATGVSRPQVSALFTKDPSFEFVRKDGRSAIYKLKEDVYTLTHDAHNGERDVYVRNTSLGVHTHQMEQEPW